MPFSGLSSLEQSLVEHVSRGEWLDLAVGGEAVDEAAMRSWGEAQTCRAIVIRDILRGRLTPDPDPRGVRLRGARISGRLDLENLSTDLNLDLKDCFLDEGILLRDAHLASVSLIGCQIEHLTEPPLEADGLTCRMLDLRRAKIVGHASYGAVCLRGARIGGQLSCGGASLHNDSGPALVADAVQVGQSMFLGDWFTATGAGREGAVRLLGAHISLNVYFDGARLANDSGPALFADGLRVDLSMFLRRRFIAKGAGDAGAVRLVGARIGGQLSCDGARLRNETGPALLADSLTVGQAIFWVDGFTATGTGQDGAVNLTSAHIGALNGNGASLRNDSGPALKADDLQAGSMLLNSGFTATGAGDVGAVRLVRAHIGSNLECDDASLRNDSGPAFVGDGLQLGGNMFLRGRFTAIGAGSLGAVRLTGANIDRNLECDGASLRDDSGPALHADRLRVGGHMFLRGRFTATGAGDLGAVRLIEAHIGQLECTEVNLRDDSGSAMDADSMQVGANLYLSGEFSGGGAGTALDLTGVSVGGALGVGAVRLQHATKFDGKLAAEGLTYTGVPTTHPAGYWLDLLRTGTPSYTAQPYQQLAAGYHAVGDDRRARMVLMGQRDDQLARTHPHWFERLWGRITKITLGYGYQPWRALLFLLAVVILSCGLTVVLGSHGALAQTSETATPGRSCTAVQQVSVGLDLNLPVGTSMARAGCDLSQDSSSVTAAWLAGTGWVLRLLAWAFAALFIAGFTSAVRKT